MQSKQAQGSTPTSYDNFNMYLTNLNAIAAVRDLLETKIAIVLCRSELLQRLTPLQASVGHIDQFCDPQFSCEHHENRAQVALATLSASINNTGCCVVLVLVEAFSLSKNQRTHGSMDARTHPPPKKHKIDRGNPQNSPTDPWTHGCTNKRTHPPPIQPNITQRD